jgi:adenylate cyclase
MEAHDDDGRGAMRAIAVAAIALAGFVFSLLPPAERIDASLLDAQWRVLRHFDRRAAADDIVIVGIDEASLRSIPEPPGLWHATLGRALAKLASAKPRAIGLEFALPERSYDAVKPGLDRALFDGLAAAVDNGPLVASLSIDARTRMARKIHTPFLALLGESRLGIDLVARDADGIARRFSLLVPTEDGGFPTLEGRLCRAMKRSCSDGLIHYSLGTPFDYVPLKNLMATSDEKVLARLFGDRIVLVGETLPFTDRIDVPINLAAWEDGGRHSPGIVVHAQTLRTALAGVAPQQASRLAAVMLLSLVALVFLVRDWRLAAAGGLAVGVAASALALLALRGGLYVPLGSVLLTLLAALAARGVVALSSRARR